MGTPDRFPGKRIEETLALSDQATPPAEIGEIQRNGDDIFAKDSVGVFNLRTGGSGITASQHKALRDLIHFVDHGPADGFASGAEWEPIYSGIKVTNETWYKDSARGPGEKIVSLDIVYSGVVVSTETWKMYDTDGTTVLVTLVDTYTYTGLKVTKIVRTWS